MVTREFRSDHAPFFAAVRELTALWADLPDGEARRAAFWQDFGRAPVGDYAVSDEVVQGGIVTLRLHPGPMLIAMLDDLRPAHPFRKKGGAA